MRGAICEKQPLVLIIKIKFTVHMVYNIFMYSLFKSFRENSKKERNITVLNLNITLVFLYYGKKPNKK